MVYDNTTQTTGPKKVLVLTEPGEYSICLDEKLNALTKESPGKYDFKIIDDPRKALQEATNYDVFIGVVPMFGPSRKMIDLACGVIGHSDHMPPIPILIVTELVDCNKIIRQKDDQGRICSVLEKRSLYGDIKYSKTIPPSAINNGFLKTLDDFLDEALKNFTSSQELQSPTK